MIGVKYVLETDIFSIDTENVLFISKVNQFINTG